MHLEAGFHSDLCQHLLRIIETLLQLALHDTLFALELFRHYAAMEHPISEQFHGCAPMFCGRINVVGRMIHSRVGIRVIANSLQETATCRFAACACGTPVNNVLEEMRYAAAQILLLVDTAGTDKHLHSYNRVDMIFLNKHR